MKQQIKETMDAQKQYFREGHTISFSLRKQYLFALKQAILRNETAIFDALCMDFNKPNYETYTTEIFLCLEAIDMYLKKGKQWLQPKRVRTSIVSFPSSGRIYRQPYGTILIISPWNYPFQLAMLPLIDAIACGNTAIVKPSESAPHTALLLQQIIEAVFPPCYAHVVLGEVEVTQQLLALPFDLIFFTGSPKIGKLVMQQASVHLTPVVLELGGKSPCVVSESADVDLAAKRIVWGKFLNAGQTCVAPDYVYLHETHCASFLAACKKYIQQFYYENGNLNKEFPALIHDNHYKHVLAMLDQTKVVVGGVYHQTQRVIEPTLLANVTWDDACMQEEIFGPLLPVLLYSDFYSAMEEIRNHPHPLAFYYFGEDKKEQTFVIDRMSFGGGCINETILHAAEAGLPFGGVGNSGMGRYHGKESVATFTYQKSMLLKKTSLDLEMKYPPYQGKTTKLKNLLGWLRKGK